MYLTDRLPPPTYNYEDSMDAGENKNHNKSMHVRCGVLNESKHSFSIAGSKKTKANSSSNDSQNALPHLKSKSRSRILAINKDHVGSISKINSKVKSKVKKTNEVQNATNQDKNSRMNTLTQEPDREVDSEKDKSIALSRSPTKNKEHKASIRSKPYTSRNSPEPEKVSASPVKALNENRKVSPHQRKSYLQTNDEPSKHKLPNYINMSNHLKENE